MDVPDTRKDFPLLNRGIDGEPLVYLDSACVTLTPNQVIDAVTLYYREYGSCGGRSIHRLGVEVARECEIVREKIRKFINAQDPGEIVFTKNTTEGINVVANGLGLSRNDKVVITDREHNSNLIVWQELQKKIGIDHTIVRLQEDEATDLESFEYSMHVDVKLVSVFHTSNLDGYTLPIKEITKIAHENEALVLIDAAQSAGHRELDVNKIDADLVCFSLHKMLGPTLGVLYGREEILEGISPLIVGGGSVLNSDLSGHEYARIPARFEGGIQNYAGIMGAGAAVDYIDSIGLKKIEEHETSLNRFVTDRLKDEHGITLLGPPDPTRRGGIFSFNIKGMDPHDVALYLDSSANIMVRSGMHCVHSWFNENRIEGSVRASFYLYNTMDEAEIFVEKIKNLLQVL